MAAVDLFLELDGVAGASVDRDHVGAIEVVAFSWAEHLSLGGGVGGGAGAGRVQLGDLQVIARTSVASPVLMMACASGRHIRTARLSARRVTGDRPRDHLVLTLTDVVVTTYRVGADESGDHTEPTDQLSLSFGAIEFTVVPEGRDGSAGAPVTGSWDRRRNAPVTRAPARKASTSKATTKAAPARKATAAPARKAAPVRKAAAPARKAAAPKAGRAER